MELNIRAGMRVLYKKNNSNWLVGEIGGGTAALDKNGLYLPIWAMTDKSDCTLVNINDIFFDAHIVDDAWKDYNILLTKNEYIKIIEEEDFIKSIEKAYVSDGEYYYYPITKFNRTWLEKQPFDYVVRF